MSLSDRWSTAFERLRGEGRLRELRFPEGLDFCSNDYLGYSSRSRTSSLSQGMPARLMPTTQSELILSRSGTASRLLRGHHPIWEEVEAALATWHGAESALMMTSGYAANEGLLATVVQPEDWVASDQLNHGSIVDGLKLAGCEKHIYRHRDLDHLEEGLQQVSATRSQNRELFIVTESLFGMEGTLAPLESLAGLAERYGAHLIVDEAHSTGCFGQNGSGCVDAAGLREKVLATVHTGGKALAVFGAYICGPARLKALLVNRCRHLLFTTALPPAVGTWWLEMLPRVQADQQGRQALHANARAFRAALADLDVPIPGSHYIVPVILGDDARAIRVAEVLRQTGWDIRAVRPPSVPCETARLRISLHADHDSSTLAAVARAVIDAVAQSGGGSRVQ